VRVPKSYRAIRLQFPYPAILIAVYGVS